jgi:uncharacterized protein (TIGR03086 family)
MDVIALHKKAGESARKFISNVKDDQWEQISNCNKWTVRKLVNHLVSENMWVLDLMEGKTIAEVGDKYDGDMVGEDPLQAFDDSQRVAQEALEKGDLNTIVHVSYGDFPASVYIGHRIVDLVVHGWDVAKSTGQDDSLDEELVQYVWDEMKPLEAEWRPTGAFGKQIEVAETVDLQTKLLALLGRAR